MWLPNWFGYGLCNCQPGFVYTASAVAILSVLVVFNIITLTPLPIYTKGIIIPSIELGFCEAEITSDVDRGDYAWEETEVGSSARAPCSFGPSNKQATRKCQSGDLWDEPQIVMCGTQVSLLFMKFNESIVRLDRTTNVSTYLLHTSFDQIQTSNNACHHVFHWQSPVNMRMYIMFIVILLFSCSALTLLPICPKYFLSLQMHTLARMCLDSVHVDYAALSKVCI